MLFIHLCLGLRNGLFHSGFPTKYNIVKYKYKSNNCQGAESHSHGIFATCLRFEIFRSMATCSLSWMDDRNLSSLNSLRYDMHMV
jgi:hypothetical protein